MSENVESNTALFELSRCLQTFIFFLFNAFQTEKHKEIFNKAIYIWIIDKK
jgi:hypothetical protein